MRAKVLGLLCFLLIIYIYQAGCGFLSNDNATGQSAIAKNDLVNVIRDKNYKDLQKYNIGNEGLNLMDPFSPQYHPINTKIMGEKSSLYNSVALKFFRKSLQNDTTLISPVAIAYSMAMIANGAKEKTLSEIEHVFEISYPEMNEYFNTYIHDIRTDAGGRLKIYNSMWLNKDKDYNINNSLLQLNADIFHNDVFSARFGEQVVGDINTWAFTKSRSILYSLMQESLPDDSMYLMNISFFEGRWKRGYSVDQIEENRSFTDRNGKTVPVTMMHSHESKYINTSRAKGFMKPYENKDYAFVCILPDEGIDIIDFVNSMDEDEFNYMLSTCMNIEVIAETPIFEVQNNLDLANLFNEFGTNSVFHPKSANLKNLGEGKDGDNLYISKAIHKTYFSVDKKGTNGGFLPSGEDVCDKLSVDALKKEVILDRPFMYMLVDTRYNIPVLMGVLTEIK